MTNSRIHVTRLTPEAAMKHERLVCGITDKPEIRLGWIPYNYRVTDRAVSVWACHTEEEFNAQLVRRGLKVAYWCEGENGISSAYLEPR